MRSVSTGVRKKDAMALVTGKPVYTQDIMPKDCLVIKILRSPHANALIESIQTEKAKKIPGIVGVYTYQDVPQNRFTTAGQTYPEPSPYDRLILDRQVRFVGDAVAIVAGEDEKTVDKALRVIKVKYQVLPAVLDFRTAKDASALVHPEENWKSICPVGADNMRNLCASGEDNWGDLEEAFAKCSYIVEGVYHTQANQQTMMETFRTYCYKDTYGRLVVVSSTQIPFHARKIVANALDIPKSKIRVLKPRIGGGFGAKQTVVSEIYPAFVTWITGRPAGIIYTRRESQIASSPRHEMEITLKIGADKNGVIRAMDMYTLSDTGAYGDHGPTTVSLTAHKSIPLYGKVEAYRFQYDVVYTNHMAAGAYRGYGATQGMFAVETAVNELAEKIGIDPIALREKNLVQEGQYMPAYYNEPNNSCALERCLQRAKEMADWEHKYPVQRVDDHTVRGMGVALAMQGSGIASVDIANITMQVNDDGFYTLLTGAADMGTGCDTILAQIAADVLECSVDNIIVHEGDTDQSPYDKGSYASSTTYVTGMATVKAAQQLREKICIAGAKILQTDADTVDFDGEKVYLKEDEAQFVSLKDIGNASMAGEGYDLTVHASNSSPVSPPPFMAGIAEVEVNLETGKAFVTNYVAVVDCGTVINTNLARVQAEGGILQGIGMALSEDIRYDRRGMMSSNSFMQYKIPTRIDVGEIQVAFESSYEPTGPFGAKSIGEIVIDTPSPAIAAAIHAATGVWFRELPITGEKIAMSRNRES